jgi:hypothetical protein
VFGSGHSQLLAAELFIQGVRRTRGRCGRSPHPAQSA